MEQVCFFHNSGKNRAIFHCISGKKVPPVLSFQLTFPHIDKELTWKCCFFASYSNAYMKKFYAFPAFLLVCFSGFAQPNLDETYFPVAGKSFAGRSFTMTTPMAEPSEGPNQTWNLTNLQSSYILDYNFSFRIKTPAQMDSAAYFPGATSGYVSFFGVDSLENFSKVNGNDLEYLGYNFKGVAISERYSIPRVELRKNLGFEENFIRVSECVQNVSGFQKFQKYRDTISYAGYGTLITSYGTYNNVIMLKRGYSIDASFTPGGPFEFSYLGRQWLWYLPGYGIPYVKYSIEVDMLVPDQTLYDGYVGFIPPPVGVAPTQNLAAIQLLPSVLQTEESVLVEGIQELKQVTISDVSGKSFPIRRLEGNRFFPPQLHKGLYSVRLTGSQGSVVRKMVVQ